MIPGLFSHPPLPSKRSELKDPGHGPDRADPDALLLAFAVTLVGIVGFLGLLIAGSLIPRYATPLRVLALIWFAAFGVWHVRTSARIR